jgi:hypothetical protein
LEPAAERPKQVLAGISSGADGPGFGAETKTQLERALAEAAAGGQLGEAFMQLNRMLANEPDKAAILRLVRALAQPYPDVAEAHFAVALAAYNTGLGDVAIAGIAMQAANRALALKAGWEPRCC